MNGSSPEDREPYWDYMGRRLREERGKFGIDSRALSNEDLWKKDMSEMQKQVHELQMKVVNLSQQVYNLNYKVSILGGDPNQMEFRF